MHEWIKVQCRQTGGFAGLNMSWEVDSRELPADKASEFRSLVEASGLLEDKEPTILSPGARDVFVYTFVIVTGSGTRQVVFDDLTLPESLASLHDYLRTTKGT